MEEQDRNYAAATLAIRAGQARTGEGEHCEPIFTTSSYVFDSAAQAAARFSGDEPGNIYSRFTNPSVQAFERRLAVMEGGEHCVATASGMAAILTLALGVLQSGDRVVASSGMFGSTVGLFNKLLRPFGVEATYVPLTDSDAWRAVASGARLFFLETPSNPLCELGDIEIIAEIAHDAGALLAVDNAFCTPVLQRPLALGADVVIHSATKYLDGQGRCVGGAVVTDDNDVFDAVYNVVRTAGPSMSPFNAWTFNKGLETLPLRMERHCSNALQLAQWLENQPSVARVYYPGLESYPQHALACRQQSDFGGMVSFEVVGGRKEAWQVVDATRFLSITANLGDVKTTITHPATTTHSRLSDAERAAAGIGESLLRVSVGLEDVGDIQNDLARGLRQSA